MEINIYYFAEAFKSVIASIKLLISASLPE